MPTPNLPISRLINVDVVLSPLAAQAQDLSSLLVLGTSDVIDVVERLRSYESIDAVAADFGTTAPEYLAALLWFEQAPQPTEIQIGRWARAASAGTLIGGLVPALDQLITEWTPIADGAMRISVNGTAYNIAGVDFSAAENMNGVAAAVQAALAAKIGGATVTWDATYQRFVVESPTTGVGSSVGFASFPPAAEGSILFVANPAAADTITLNGTVVTFVAGAPVGNQVQIGVDLAATMAALVAFLDASADAQLVKFNYSLTGARLNLEAATVGAGGNALTIAASAAAPSGATLTGGTGTDIATMMALKVSSSGAYQANGIAAETALEATTLFDSLFGQTWYALTIPEADNDDHIDVGGYIEATNNKHLYGVSTQEAGVLSSVSTTDIAYLLAQLRYKKTVVQYSSSNPYSVCSLLGRALTVNYNGNATVITLMYKQEPGIVAESLQASQLNALEAKNCNVFVAYNNNTAIIEQGKVSSGDFIDTITGTDWLAVTIMTAIYNLLYTASTKIPQTDAGTHLIVVTIESVLSIAVANGLLAPGVWNANGFGTLTQGAFLAKGWYVYAPPVATQLQADREARKSVPLQVAAKLAGAVHTVDVIINVNR